jgi:alpha-1,4-digalacturonate transport system permease protein
VFFFPVLLSPVVVGLIWRWILQREGLLNLMMVNLGLEPQVWLNDRTYALPPPWASRPGRIWGSTR